MDRHWSKRESKVLKSNPGKTIFDRIHNAEIGDSCQIQDTMNLSKMDYNNGGGEHVNEMKDLLKQKS